MAINIKFVYYHRLIVTFSLHRETDGKKENKPLLWELKMNGYIKYYFAKR